MSTLVSPDCMVRTACCHVHMLYMHACHNLVVSQHQWSKAISFRANSDRSSQGYATQCSSQLETDLTACGCKQEESNQVKGQKPYRESLSGQGSAEEQADEAWQYGRSRCNGAIQEMYTGQMQSCVTCSSCGHQSYTFADFPSLSLTLPHKLGSNWLGVSMQVDAHCSFFNCFFCRSSATCLTLRLCHSRAPAMKLHKLVTYALCCTVLRSGFIHARLHQLCCLVQPVQLTIIALAAMSYW